MPRDRINALKNRGRDSRALRILHVREQGEGILGKPGSKPSPSILVSDVPASGNIYRNKCLLCKLLYLVTVADAD